MPDGTSQPFDEHQSRKSNAIRARLLRQAGIHDYDPDPNSDYKGVAREVHIGGMEPSQMSAAQLEAYAIDSAQTEGLQEERAMLKDQTNDYIDEPDLYAGDDARDSYGSPAVEPERG
jgi:hypothetical protein